jgi:hypothetical protein
MPFMQRITWSGIAIHAGVLPGYPASHGCIRMPMAFAVKMFGWTKMGARVVITPGEISPDSFSHPLLAAQKVVPQPVAPDNVEKASVETPVAEQAPPSTPLREQTHTADAGSTLPATTAPVTKSDATPETVAVKTGDGSNGETKMEAAKVEAAKPDAAKTEEKTEQVASAGDKPVETKSSEAAAPETKPAEADASNGAGKKPDEAAVSAEVRSDTAKTEATTGESVKAAGETKVEAKSEEVKTDDAKTDLPVAELRKSIEKPDDQIKPAAIAAPDVKTAVADVKKDQTRLTDALKSAASKPESATAAAPKRSGQIAVFISRKDAKLYVRQNFAPLYDSPVTIAPSDRPLGTHVFTAQADKDDANVLHWSVVSLPAPARSAGRQDEDERATRRRKIAGAVEMKPAPVPDSAAEALDRITIPADVMARITESLSTGGSIIVSDQGITAGETGEGTDFIVSLR